MSNCTNIRESIRVVTPNHQKVGKLSSRLLENREIVEAAFQKVRKS